MTNSLTRKIIYKKIRKQGAISQVEPTTSASSLQEATPQQTQATLLTNENGTIALPKTGILPVNSNWKGEYGFDIYFDPQQEKTTKSTSCTYSEMKDKLFVNTSVACPIHFYTTSPPPAGCIIRAMATFSKPEHWPKPVKRCLNHSSPNHPSNEGHSAPDHLIRCGNPHSQYVTDQVTGRDSVTTPYISPHVGTECTTYLYMFMCLGTCVGGIDRKPLQVIFTLEKDGDILGRRMVEVKICASPGRDRRNEELTLTKRSHVEISNGSENAFNSSVFTPAMKRLKTTNQDDEVFTITIRGRKNFEILQKIRNAFELARLINPEKLALLKNTKDQ